MLQLNKNGALETNWRYKHFYMVLEVYEDGVKLKAYDLARKVCTYQLFTHELLRCVRFTFLKPYLLEFQNKIDAKLRT